MRAITSKNPLDRLLAKLRTLAAKLALEKGDFDIFGLFLRADAPGVWDLVAAAPWLKSSGMESLTYLADRLKAALKPQEMMMLSGIYILERGGPILYSIRTTSPGAESRLGQIDDFTFNGIRMATGHIIASRVARIARR